MVWPRSATQQQAQLQTHPNREKKKKKKNSTGEEGGEWCNGPFPRVVSSITHYSSFSVKKWNLALDHGDATLCWPHDMKGLFLRRFDVILKLYGVDLVGADNRPLFGIERDAQI